MKLVKLINPILHKGEGVNPNYLFVDTVDSGLHIDLTSIENVSTLGVKTGRDFLFLRAQLLIILTAAGGFSSLTESEKRVIIEHSLSSQTDALTVVSQAEYDAVVDNYQVQSKASRTVRAELARRKFGQEIVKGTLSYADSNQFFSDSKNKCI